MNHRGFSLVELLVAMAIASVLGMAGVALFSTSNWTYKVNEDVSEAQQNVRVAMEWLSKDIRTAGFGLDDPPTSLNFDGNTFTAPITVTNSSTGYDTITILGIGYEAGKLENSAGDTTCNGTDDNYICLCKTSSICPNDYEKPNSFFSTTSPYPYQSVRRYITLNGTTFIELSSTAGDHNRDTGKMKLSNPATLDKPYADGTPVYIIQAVTYSIATDLTGCSSTNPCLASADYTMLRGGSTPGARQVLAENIEDIQFAYGIDVNPRDGKIDDTTSNVTPGVATSADGNFTYADYIYDPADDTSIIAVRANVVAKTGNIDMKGGQFTRPAVEDRAAATSSDGYRRRLLTKIIKLRNPRSGGS